MLRRLLLLAAFVGLLVVPVSHAAAYDLFSGFKGTDGKCTANTSTATICSANGTDTISGTNGILRKVTNTIAILAGVTAVVLVIISGFQYVTSGGDPQKTATAQNALIGAIVGVLIVVVAESLLQFVLKAT